MTKWMDLSELQIKLHLFFENQFKISQNFLKRSPKTNAEYIGYYILVVSQFLEALVYLNTRKYIHSVNTSLSHGTNI